VKKKGDRLDACSLTLWEETNMPASLSPRQTLLSIGLPMLATFAGTRLHLHLGGVQHVYPFGYLLHHLYTGALLVIGAAFLLAFASSNRLVALLTRVVLGIGSALVLDELVYLVVTQASDTDYVSSISWWGSVIFMGFGTMLLLALYWLHRDKACVEAQEPAPADFREVVEIRAEPGAAADRPGV
jgi:hypothetical protein